MFARFWQLSRDYLLFATLMLLSLVVLLSQDGPALRAARAASLEATARVEGLFAGLGRYTDALGENDDLRAEAIALSTEVARLREAAVENERLRALVGMEDSTGYDRVLARVVAKDITEQNNRLTINVGARDGVREGMPVIDEKGIVGKVVVTSPNYALVMPHQNTAFSVPATVALLQQDGTVRWDGRTRDRLIMEYVPKTEPIIPGQLVVTSSFSDVFPPGLAVGTVDSVFAAPGRNDYVIYLEPASTVTSADYVYVLLTPPDSERVALQDAEFVREAVPAAVRRQRAEAAARAAEGGAATEE